MKRLLFSILWGYGLSLLAFFLLRKATGDLIQPVRLINYFLPWVAVGLLPALVSAVWCRKKALSLLLLAGLLQTAFSFSYLFTNCGARAYGGEGSRTLKVMSYNVWKLNRDYAAVARVIADQDPELVLLQEVLPHQLRPICENLERLSGHADWSVAHDLAVDQALISRYPVVENKTAERSNRAQIARVRSPFGDIRVINVHAYRDGWKARHEGMERILSQYVLPESIPVILGGDLNTTDQAETFGTVRRHLMNAHLEAGCGFGFTFPAADTFLGLLDLRLPAWTGLVRIDHIFYSRDFHAVSAYTVAESGGSDHFPVVAELEFKPAGRGGR